MTRRNRLECFTNYKGMLTSLASISSLWHYSSICICVTIVPFRCQGLFHIHNSMEDYHNLSEALSRVLRRKREGIGMSKLGMSKLIHMERAYITALERGAKRPTLNAVFYICDALGMSRHEFLAEIESEMEILDQREG